MQDQKWSGKDIVLALLIGAMLAIATTHAAFVLRDPYSGLSSCFGNKSKVATFRGDPCSVVF
jgi:hypothetical protein